MSATLPVTVKPVDCCVTSCDDVVVSQVPGPAGADGASGAAGTNGVSAFTSTTAQYTQPAVGNNVTIAVTNSTWAAVGEPIFVSVGGSYLVVSKPDSTHLQIQNLGYTGNAAPAAIVATSQVVTPSGIKGDTGSAGAGTLNALSPTTTKGDIIVDNGANSPSASDVRLPVGTDGQQLTSVAAQPTGLQWKTLLPNATTDNGLPRFDGTSGTPVPLQTSKVIINDNGAVQATGSGGNARGTDAVDLQVNRVANTQVASGNKSFIGGGDNNTASGTDSVVTGGATNTASGTSSNVGGGSNNTASGNISTVGGGSGNTASGDVSVISGGTGNDASGDFSFVGSGDTNTASADYSSVVSGENNTASGPDAFIGGGSSNQASGTLAGILAGFNAKADHYGQQAQASGAFAANGDAQTSIMTLFGATTNVTPTEIFLDNSSARMTIPSDTTWAFRMLIVARRTDVDDESAAYQLLGCIDRNAAVGTTALVGSVSKTVIAEDTAAWDVTASADSVNGALILTVTGENAKTIRWVAKVELTQVSG